MSADRYRVVWRYAAQSRAQDIVRALVERGEERTSFFQAMARINLDLAVNPGEKGESRTDRERIIFERPVTVTFEVHPDQQVVVILGLNYYRPKVDRD